MYNRFTSTKELNMYIIYTNIYYNIFSEDTYKNAYNCIYKYFFNIYNN